MKRLTDHFRNTFGALDLADPLAQGAVELAIIDFLERLAIFLIARYLTDENHHRCRILHRGMHADRAIAGARRTGHHGDARLAGELAVRLCHISGPAFLAARDDFDLVRRIVQRVDQGKIALARHAERRIDIVNFQLVGEDLTARGAWHLPFYQSSFLYQ